MIPTSWSDVSFLTFTRFLNALKKTKPDDDPFLFLSIRTGVDADVLKKIPIDIVQDFDRLTSFFFDASTLSAFDFVDENILVPVEEKKGLKFFRYYFRKLLRIKQPVVDVAVMSWEQLEKAKQEIKRCVDADEHHMSAADEIFFVYCGERLNHMPVPAAYGIACFFLHKLTRFRKSFQG